MCSKIKKQIGICGDRFDNALVLLKNIRSKRY